MICKFCESNVADGAKICDFCGSPIAADALKQATPKTDKQHTDSMDIFKITVAPDAEDKKTKGAAGIHTTEYYDIDMPENKHSSYYKDDTEISRHKSEKISNGNNNIAIYVMLGTIIALVCFIVIILVFPKDNEDIVEEAVVNEVISDEPLFYEEVIVNDYNSTNTDTYYENDYTEEEHVNDDFFFPSDKKYISEYDLRDLTKEEVAMIRNEIYARHGYIFNTEPYKSYFEHQEWYTPNPNFDDSLFNIVEEANKDFIVEYEESMGWR